MRETGIGSGLHLSSRLATRALRMAAVARGLGLVLFSGPRHAQDADDEEDDRTFERKIIDNLMSGLGGRRLEDGNINYRERSPLVVPSKIALPPPQSGSKAKLAPNWPKDPDEAERKAAREAAKQKPKTYEESLRPLMPSELNQRAPRGSTTSDVKPGGNNSNQPPILMPSELGFTGGLFSNPFSSKSEADTFTTEPERTELTQPPSGYQTPSTTYAYGVGNQKLVPKENCDAASGKCEKRWVFQ